MASKGVSVQLTYANGQTLDKFRQVIAARMKWCNESARDSIAACAIDALRSIRAKCKVAKKSKIKVNVVEDNSLYASFTSNGKQKFPCVRYKGSKQRYAGTERIRVGEGMAYSELKVFRFRDEYADVDYLILASSCSVAKKKAKDIVVKRAMRYSGLARRAMGFLMQKTVTKRVNDPFDPVVEAKADDVTTKYESVKKTGDSGTYTLILTDVLKYALDAIKGGKAEVDASLKRAMNKIVSVVNQKLKRRKNDFFAPAKIESPFPELKKRK